MKWIKIEPYDATCRGKDGYATTTRCKQNDNIFEDLEHHGYKLETMNLSRWPLDKHFSIDKLFDKKRWECPPCQTVDR